MLLGKKIGYALGAWAPLCISKPDARHLFQIRIRRFLSGVHGVIRSYAVGLWVEAAIQWRKTIGCRSNLMQIWDRWRELGVWVHGGSYAPGVERILDVV